MEDLKLDLSSETIGYHRTYFSAMKNRQPDKYNFILSFDGVTMSDKYTKYIKWLENVNNDYLAIADKLEELDIPKFRFSKWLHEKGILPDSRSYSAAWYMTVNGYVSAKNRAKITEAFKEFLNDRTADTKENY